jgi:hypothetical protein
MYVFGNGRIVSWSGQNQVLCHMQFTCYGLENPDLEKQCLLQPQTRSVGDLSID